jgi:tetratricopeptide (TPR) repeat protein
MNEFGYYYQGKFISQPNAKAVYVAVFKLFGELDPSFYTNFYESKHNRGIRRTYLSRDINELYPNRNDLAERHTDELPDEWKLGTNLNVQSMENIIRRACKVANIPYSGKVFYVVLGDGVTGEFLDGQFRLRIIAIRNDSGNSVTRYIAENVRTGEIVSVKFRDCDKLPERYIGRIGDFDGNDNDIQTNPRGNIRTGRQGATFGNPFDPYSYAGMSEALESKDNLHRVKASDVGPGNYWCYNCYGKAHWRHLKGRSAHFYHWRRNPECELCSDGGGGWDIQALENKFNPNYQERWIETINDLIEFNNLYLLEGQSWARNPIEWYLRDLNSKTDSETYSDIIFDIKEVLSSIPPDPHPVEPVTNTTPGHGDGPENKNNNAASDYYRGLESYYSRKYKDAIEHFTRAIEINPQYTDAHYYCGRAYYNMKKYNLAIEHFTQAININPHYTDAHYYCGRAYYNMKKYNLAIEHFTQAININPQYADAYYYRGCAYYDMKNYALAIEDLMQAGRHMKNYNLAIDYCFTRAITINPQYADAYYYRGRAYYNMNNYNLAVKDFTQAITINSQYADAYCHRGRAYYDMKNYDFAIADLTQAININPQYAEAYYYRGRAYYDMKNYNLAIEDFTRAININPQYAEAYYYRGRAYYDMKNYNLAIEDFTRAIEFEPQYTDAYYYLGRAHFNMENYNLAIEDFTQVVKINWNDADAHYYLGRAHFNMENYNLAIKDFTQVVRIEPNYAKAYYYRGRAYSYMNNYEAARADFTQVKTLDQNYEELIRKMEIQLV